MGRGGTLSASLASMTHRATTNLKELHLKLPTLIKPWMDYLSSHVFEHLDFFEPTTLSGINLERWCEIAEKAQSMLKFVGHISSIKNLVIKNGYHIGSLKYSSSAKNLGFFWAIANAIQGSRDLECHVSFSMSLYSFN